MWGMVLAWAWVLLLWMVADSCSGMRPDFVVPVLLCGVVTGALLRFLFRKQEVHVGDEAVELWWRGKCARRMPYADCGKAFRWQERKGGAMLCLVCGHECLGLRESDWQGVSADFPSLSALLEAKLPPTSLREGGKGMYLCHWCVSRDMARFLCILMMFLSVAMGMSKGLQELHRQATQLMACDPPAPLSEQTELRRFEMPTDAGVYEWEGVRFTLTKREVPPPPGRLTTMHMESGLAVLYHYLTGTLPAWQRQYKAYAESHPLLFKDVPIGTPYWEYTIEGTQGNVVCGIGFVTKGESCDQRRYDERAHVHGGVLMNLPAYVELWCQPAEE